jgi:saccharopine dehydrogenase-like NADP-dependent oxidoreductase
MKVLLVGVGGVGEAISVLCKNRSWVTQLILADYRIERAKEVQGKLHDSARFPVEFVDASNQAQVEDLTRKYQVDLVMNGCDPIYNVPIFEAAYQYGCNYMDMAMTLSEPHPSNPFNQTGVKLGDYQFEHSNLWEKKGNLAVVGLGVEPGMVDVFARYAQDHLFDDVEEFGVRDGANLIVRGYDFAPNFSIWTTIEECLNPPIIWEKEKGWFTTKPFSEPEIFDFPQGIGSIECVNVEHEEVLLMPRWLKCKRVTFKYGLGNQFINVLEVLHMIGLDKKEPIKVKEALVSPRDVVAACLPDPAHLGELMDGETCAGLWVKGKKNELPRQVYIYQVANNAECMKKYGCQAVVTQTAFSPIIGWELIEKGIWKGVGVLGPEAFPSEPFMEKMLEYGFPYGIQEIAMN